MSCSCIAASVSLCCFLYYLYKYVCIAIYEQFYSKYPKLSVSSYPDDGLHTLHSGDEGVAMTTTAQFGRMDPFVPEEETIAAYLERIEVYFEANEIPAEKRVAVFLSVIGGKTYSLLRDLLSPDKPCERTFAALSETLRRHFQPKKVIIAERFRFHRRNQAAGETVVQYVAELRRLSAHCDFADYLDQALRDGFVCGLQNESIQRRLSRER